MYDITLWGGLLPLTHQRILSIKSDSNWLDKRYKTPELQQEHCHTLRLRQDLRVSLLSGSSFLAEPRRDATSGSSCRSHASCSKVAPQMCQVYAHGQYQSKYYLSTTSFENPCYSVKPSAQARLHKTTPKLAHPQQDPTCKQWIMTQRLAEPAAAAAAAKAAALAAATAELQ